MNKLKGGCLCGVVRFEVTGDIAHFFLCHCSRCQRGSGSAYAANLILNDAQLEWSSGQSSVKNFVLPGSAHTRSFCENCGTPMPCWESTMLLVPAGAVEGEIRFEPDAHIFVADKAGWEEGLSEVRQWATLPE